MANGILSIPIPGRSILVGGSTAVAETDRAAATAEFVVGPENAMVECAVCAVLEGPPTKFNPLVFSGASGTGKSHLAKGLEGVWRMRHGRKRRVEYTTGADFARELGEAIKAQATDDFRTKYRAAALLIFDDLEELDGKQAAQEELVHTLDGLLAAGGRFVGTAKVLPAALRSLASGLTSRLGMGLTVPLEPPGPQARRTLLSSFADRRDFPLDEVVVDVLAEELELTAPELLGAILQLETVARLDGMNIDVVRARHFVRERINQSLPPLREIAAATAKHYALRLSDLRGPLRQRAIVAARDVAIYLVRELRHDSFEEIGRFFGRRDHTTVLHSYRKVAGLMASDAATRQAIEEVRGRWA